MSDAETRHYLNLADEEIVAARDNLRLGHLRAAVSRAYYAMFYAATALLGSRGLWRSKHQGLIAAFGEHFVRPGLIEPRYGRMLHDAFEMRLDSDYAPHPDLDESSATRLIADAADFVKRILEMLTTPPTFEEESTDDPS
ncbi:MAG: hypothetical protein DDG58_09120 [Ardenticatenia bacterium]|nr:MAG: hypothetical protein DDG58_09120 [Ardenticatenia bacterium]